jgi:hypothetical protein
VAVIIGRSGWGALPPNRIVPSIDFVDSFVLHHSVTAQPTSFDESVAQVQQIQRQHLAKLNPAGDHEYADIAYNVVAGWNCALVGRGVTVCDGATDTDPTTATWSVCVLGDYTKDLVPPEIRAGIVTALYLGFDLYGNHPIRPHRDFYPTACPGGNLIGLIPSLQAELDDTGDMTDTDIDKLATAIVDKFFTHPMTLRDDAGAYTYASNVQGALTFIHGELKTIRQHDEKVA